MMLASVIASSFEFETAQRNLFTFDSDVSGEFTKDDLTVWNLSSSIEPALDRANLALANTTANTWALTFPGYTYTAVPDGNYETIIEKQGIAGLIDDHVLPFWFYGADFNRDRKVDIADFSILSSNINTAQTYSGGDTTYDGTANISDFSIMSAKFNMSLNPPPRELNDLTLGGLADPVTLDPFIRLTWSPPQQSDPPRLGYRIWRSTDGVDFGSVYGEMNDPNAISFDDTDVSEGTHYWYRVRPFSAAGNAHTTPKRDMITPLIAPSDLAIQQLDSTRFQLSWVNNSLVATSFHIFRSATPGLSSREEVGVVPVGSPLTFTHTLPNGEGPQQWFYFVQAANVHANSAPSNVAATRPAHPQQVSVSLSTSPLRLDLDWPDSPEGNVTYNVYRDTTLDFDSGVITQLATGLSTSQFSDSTVLANTRYYYRVTAVQSGQESFPSEAVDQVTGTNTAPSDLQATTVDDDAIEVTWTDNSANETGYAVDIFQGSSLGTV